MAERASAAMHIDLLMLQGELLHRSQSHDRKSLIDLEEIDVCQRPTCLVHEFAQSADWRRGKRAWCLRMGGMGADRRKRHDGTPGGLRARHEHERRRAI